MSGRPGPRIQTGDLRRGVDLVIGTPLAGQHRALVGSRSPQARRLERGFIGTDSAGRHYEQPAYPAFRPAVDLLGPQYAAALGSALEMKGTTS
jgi:hypothetical protein